MSKTAWIKSLLIPVITAIASIVIIMIGVGVSGNHVFTLLFGLLTGGILPIILVAALKKDLSKYFRAKMILLVLTAVTYVLYFTPLEKFLPLFTDSMVITFILPTVLSIAEVIYALIKGEKLGDKICLILSSPLSVIWGLLLDVFFNIG